MPPTKEQQSTGTNDGDTSPKARAGRPRKMGKLKILHTILPTGKGRGRPKKLPPTPQELKILIAKGKVISKTKRPKKSKGTGGKIGRPRKEKLSESDGENDDEVEPPRPVGRPATGAVNLNIARTGRGQGRPKKSKTSDSLVPRTQSSNKSGAKRKPGRPSLGGVKYQPTGKPRGRPKGNKIAEEEKEKSEDGSGDDEDDSTSQGY